MTDDSHRAPPAWCVERIRGLEVELAAAKAEAEGLRNAPKTASCWCKAAKAHCPDLGLAQGELAVLREALLTLIGRVQDFACTESNCVLNDERMMRLSDMAERYYGTAHPDMQSPTSRRSAYLAAAVALAEADMSYRCAEEEWRKHLYTSPKCSAYSPDGERLPPSPEYEKWQAEGERLAGIVDQANQERRGPEATFRAAREPAQAEKGDQ